MSYDRKALYSALAAIAPKDPLRLIIKGFAEIEQAIDAAIAEAFGGETPSALRRLPFPTRLVCMHCLIDEHPELGRAIDSEGKRKRLPGRWVNGALTPP